MRVHTTTLEEDLISRLNAADAELEVLRTEVDRMQRLAMVGTLAAGVVHEINNLLTPVIAYAQLAHAKPDDAKMSARLAEQCLIAVSSASQVADAILGFTTPVEANSRANIRAVADGAILCLGRDPERDGIQLCTDIPDRLHAKIAPLALQQVLLNLLINALNALKGRRGAMLYIEARTAAGRIKIVVRDNGPGIVPEVLPQLFKAFAVSRETGGTGLGLWISKRLIDDAGGSVTIDTGDDGTAFTISLPAA